MAIPKFIAPSRIDVNLNGFVNALGRLDEFDGVAASDKQRVLSCQLGVSLRFFPRSTSISRILTDGLQL